MMVVADHISAILTVTGGITALPIFQFFFPAQTLKLLSKLSISDECGIFFARHWGILAFSIGALLIYAGAHAEARAPIMQFALIEKSGWSRWWRRTGAARLCKACANGRRSI